MTMRPFPCTRRPKSGFTLIEMMITLMIFVLLCGAVFALMTSMLQSASILQDNSDRRDQVTALNDYLKTQLETMTSHSTLFSYIRGNGDGLNQTGIIFGTTASAMAFDAQSQPNSLYTLRVTTYYSDPTQLNAQDARSVLQQLASSDDPSLSWTNLVSDIKTLDWKFQDPNGTDWLEQWTAANNPNVIEFSLQPGGDTLPTTMDFWIPKLDTINIRVAAPPATGTGTGTGTGAGTGTGKGGGTGTGGRKP